MGSECGAYAVETSRRSFGLFIFHCNIPRILFLRLKNDRGLVTWTFREDIDSRQYPCGWTANPISWYKFYFIFTWLSILSSSTVHRSVNWHPSNSDCLDWISTCLGPLQHRLELALPLEQELVSFFLYISNQGIQSAIGGTYLFFTTFRFPCRRLNQKWLFVVVSVWSVVYLCLVAKTELLLSH